MSISYFEKKFNYFKYIIFGSKCPAVVDMMLGESNNLPLFYKSATFFLHFSSLIMTKALVIKYLGGKMQEKWKSPRQKDLAKCVNIQIQEFFFMNIFPWNYNSFHLTSFWSKTSLCKFFFLIFHRSYLKQKRMDCKIMTCLCKPLKLRPIDLQ